MKRTFDDYCNQSGIRSFAFLRNSVNKVEWALWLLLIFATAILTVRGIYLTSVKFASKPTITKVTIRNLESITLPYNPILCVTLDPFEQLRGYPQSDEELFRVIDEFLQSVVANQTTSATVLDVESYLGKILQQTQMSAEADVTNFVTYILNSTFGQSWRTPQIDNILAVDRSASRYLSEDDFIFKGYPGLQEFVAVATKTLILITLQENAHNTAAGFENVDFSADTPSTYLYKYDKLDLTPFLDLLVLGKSIWPIQIKPVDMNNLMKLVGGFLCLQAQTVVLTAVEAPPISDRKRSTVTGSGKLIINATIPCRSNSITWIGPGSEEDETYECLQLEREAFKYRLGKNDKTYLTISPTLVFSQNVFTNKDALSDIIDGYFTIDFTGGLPTQKGEGVNIYYTNERTVDTISMSIVSRSNSMNLERLPCSKTRSIADCYGMCRAMFIKQQCNCWPFSWSHLPERRDFPTTHNCFNGTYNHQRCLWTNTTLMGTDQACIAKHCHKRCEVFILNSVHTPMVFKGHTSYSNQNGKNSFVNLRHTKSVVKVYEKSFNYPFYEEVLEMDEMALLASLGGNLSLWIGGSFMALIHILVFFARLPLISVLQKISAERTHHPTANNANRKHQKEVQTPNWQGHVQENIFSVVSIPRINPHDLKTRLQKITIQSRKVL